MRILGTDLLAVIDDFTFGAEIIPGPTVTDANISITSTPSGAGGTYKVGDTITAQWNNTAGGDNNAGITGVTMDFSAFGGGAAVVATNSAETWSASYTLVGGTVDGTNLNVSVTATNGTPTTTADSSNLTADNQAPTVTDANISISGASGSGGAYRIGDTVTATWNNTAGGDNNADISTVTVDFSQFGGGAAVTATNAAGSWTATYTIVAGATDGTSKNVSVTATDDASNASTTADTTNATVDNVAPTVTDGNLVISGGSGSGGAYKIGDTVTAVWNNTAGGDNNTDTISSVTVDFTAFGGGAAVSAVNSAGTWTATYTIVAGAIDGINKNVSVTATDNAGNATTTADSSNAVVDNIAPTVTAGNIALSGASGSGGAFKIGDTVTATWNNTAGGDNNTDTISAVTVNFSAFGGGAAVAATNSAGTWTATYTIAAGAVDGTNLNVSVSATDNAGNATTTAGTDNATLDSVAPTVTDANIAISGASGTGGAYIIGDTVTATWNNTAGGDNNADTMSAVTVDFSAFGGGAAVAAANSAGTWTATYTITAGAVDGTNLNVSVTAIDNAGNATTAADTTNATVDSVAPTVSDANISISGASGTGGAYKIGDTVTATWNNTAGGDNNADTISSVSVNFSAFGGGAAVAASNNAGTWTATYTITAGAVDGTNLNVSVTATDNAGNTTTTADTSNATVDSIAPTVTDANISLSGASGTGGAYIVGDTVTATWNNTGTGDNNADTISGVTVDFSAFGGGAAVAAANSAGSWAATYTITENGGGVIDATALNVSVTATDNAGNTTTTADTTGATLDNDSPGVPAGTLAVDENSANATAVGTVTGGGADGIVYTLIDNAGGRFAISAVGAVTVANGTLLDRETNASHNITVRATDNAGNTTDAVLSVTVNDVNEAPAVDLDATTGGLNFTTSFSAGGAAVTIANTDATVIDVDAGAQIASLTVTITNVQDVGSESLSLNASATSVASGAGLTVSTGAALTVSGNATPATYQSILRGVQYNNALAPASVTPGARTINVVVNDGALASTPAVSTVNVVTAPVVSLPAATYIEGDGTTLEAAAATVQEPDGDNLNLMTITLTNPLDAGETLTLSGGAGAKGATGITATYTSATLITLTGVSSAANYQGVLRELQYSNTSEAPDTTTRSVDVVGRDINGNSGATATLSLAMTAVNDAPAFAALDGAPAYTENGAAVVLDGNVTVSDFELDAAADYSGAVLTLSRNGGANANDVFAVTTGGFATVTSNSGGTLVLTFGAATGANVASVLQSITYSNASEAPAASAQIDWSLSDGNAGAQGTGGALSAAGAATVAITAVNDAPTLAGGPAALGATNEDVTSSGVLVSSIIGGVTYSEPDGSATQGLAVSATSGSGLWQFSTDNVTWTAFPAVSTTTALLLDSASYVRFVPSANWNGAASLSFQGWDQSSGVASTNGAAQSADATVNGGTTAFSTASASGSLTVTAVNDAPVISSDGGLATAALNAAENQVAVTTVTYTDVEGDVASYSLGGADLGKFAITGGGVLTFVNAPDMENPTDANADGVYEVTVTVDDGNGGSDSQAISVTVTNVNETPGITGTPATNAPDGVAYSFIPVGSDPDAGTTLTYSIVNKPAWAAFNTATGELSGIPAAGDIGSITAGIIISVSDGSLSASLAAFDLTVTQSNQAPTIGGTPATGVGDDVAYSFTPTASDADGDTLTFSIVNPPTWAAFDTATGALTGTPVTSDIGITTGIVISVSDGVNPAVSLAAFDLEVFADNDNDNIADSVDPDDDNDGMTDVWELANGLDPLNAADAALDSDGDGLSNLDEFLGGKDPQADDVAPVVTAPADIAIDATGLFTTVDLGAASANDALDGALVPSADALSHFAPGNHVVTWSATDAAGNTGSATQNVSVTPQVSFSKDQTRAEGSQVLVSVILNGPAVTYPVSVPYTVSGTSALDGSDHNLAAGSVTIDCVLANPCTATEALISFNLVDDGPGEGTETVILSLGSPTNAVAGPRAQHTVQVIEGNVAPLVSLSAVQQAETRRIIPAAAGAVTVTAQVDDANPLDSHTYNWSGSDNALVDTDGVASTFTFDPAGLTSGLYVMKVSVTDSGGASRDAELKLNVIAAAPTLGTGDSDGDGSNDVTEGFGDTDDDGVPEYLDAVASAPVLQGQAGVSSHHLLEAEPGLSLRLGAVAFAGGNGAAGVSGQNLTDAGLAADSHYSNVGGLFDFEVSGLPQSGQTVNVVIPQLSAIPANAVYRKLMPGGWQAFVEDANNAIASAPGESGFCPPPGDASFTPGLTEGHWCVQLSIEDGGPNDADGVADNAVKDPGGVGIALAVPVTLQATGGGGAMHPLWLLLGLLGLLVGRRRLLNKEGR